MPTEQNKAIARRLIAAINEQDLNTLDEVLAPELAKRFKERTVPWLYSTFGEGHRMTITDLLAEGDKVWLRLATSGGHTGEWLGVPPTGKQWTNTGMYFLGLDDSKVVELSVLFDNLNLLQQLGAMITPPATVEQ